MKQLTTGDTFIFGDFRLDLAIGRLDRRDEGGVFQRVVIGERAIEVLGVLAERAGEVVSKQDIMAAVWSNTAVEGNLTVQIAALRRILDDPKTGVSGIRTVFRRGYCLAVPVTHVPSRPGSPSPISIPPGQPAQHFSIKVMPLVSLSDDPDLRWLGRRITEHTSAKLSHLPAVQVVACEEKSIDGQQGSKQIHTDYSLEGSLWLLRGCVRVSVRLIETETGRYVWADQFDEMFQDVSETEDTISGRLVRSISIQLLAAAARRLETRMSVDWGSSELTTCGWAWLYRPWAPGSLRTARAAFEGALAIDPDCIDAKIGTALTCVVQLLEGWSNATLLDQIRAETLLIEAIECDPTRAMAYHALGMLRRSQIRLPDARAALNRAVELDRNDVGAVYQLGLALLYEGDPESAISHIEKSIRLSPHDPQRAAMLYGLGRCHMVLGDSRAALECFNQTLAVKPNHWDARVWRAGSLGLSGDLTRARAEFAEAAQLKPEIDSLARWRAYQPWITYPSYQMLRDATLHVGLRAAGMHEE